MMPSLMPVSVASRIDRSCASASCRCLAASSARNSSHASSPNSSEVAVANISASCSHALDSAHCRLAIDADDDLQASVGDRRESIHPLDIAERRWALPVALVRRAHRCEQRRVVDIGNARGACRVWHGPRLAVTLAHHADDAVGAKLDISAEPDIVAEAANALVS